MYNFSDTPRIIRKSKSEGNKYYSIAKALSENPNKYLLVEGFATGSGVDYMKKRLQHFLPEGEIVVSRKKRANQDYVAEACYHPRSNTVLPAFSIR